MPRRWWWVSEPETVCSESSKVEHLYSDLLTSILEKDIALSGSMHVLLNLDQQDTITWIALDVQQMQETIPCLQPIKPDACPSNKFIACQCSIIFNLDS